MTVHLPFEYGVRWKDSLRERFPDLDDEVIAYLELRDRQVEDYLAERNAPLTFHWSGAMEGYVNVRNGPGKRPFAGTVVRIEYSWDTPPPVAATVEWYLAGSLLDTHTVAADDDDSHEVGASYPAAGHLVAIVTSVDSTAEGLTADVYF